MIFIHSFNPDISIAPLQVHNYSEALPATVINSVRVYATKRYRQPYTVYNNYILYSVSEGLTQGPWRGGYRMGFEPTTFRSKGIESTNVPPCPLLILIGNCKKTIK